MKMTVILIVVGALATVSDDTKRDGGRIETILTTALLKSDYFVLDIWGDFLSYGHQGKLIRKTCKELYNLNGLILKNMLPTSVINKYISCVMSDVYDKKNDISNIIVDWIVYHNIS